MLSEGMGDQLDAVVLRTPATRQTLFFSATWPEEARVLAARMCRAEPKAWRTDVCPDEGSRGISGNNKIRQNIIVFDEDESESDREAHKFARLLELLQEVLFKQSAEELPEGVLSRQGAVEGKALVFCTTKKFADELVLKLDWSGWPAAAVHGNKSQPERFRNLDAFSRGACRVLVATDVLGRGLDIPDVTHVFVYDFAFSLQEYAHRIGRTARGINGCGEAVCFFEYAPSLPTIAAELVDFLEAMQQEVPEPLRRIAHEVASGMRTRASWNRQGQEAPAGTEQIRGGSAARPEEEWVPLARPDELGPWNAGGQRSWMLMEQGAKDANGWFVICTGGRLQTHMGCGSWEVDRLQRLRVIFSGFSYELQLHKTWEGAKRDHFASVACCPFGDGSDTPPYTVLNGWVTRSKTYKYKYKE